MSMNTHLTPSRMCHAHAMHDITPYVYTHVMRMHTHVFTRVHGITPPPSHAYAYACDAYAHACAHAFTGMHTYAFDAITHVTRMPCMTSRYVSHACHAWHHATTGTPSHAYAYVCDAYAASPSHAYAASPSHAYAYACDAYACACVHTRSRHHDDHANHPLTRMHTHVMRMHTHVLTRSRVLRRHTHLMPSHM
jgi:hypothetical protein